MLHLEEERKSVQVFFHAGTITGAETPSPAGDREMLGQRLIRGNLLSPERWKSACAEAKEQLVPVERVLLKTGEIRTEDLTAVLRLLTSETIYNVFKWKGGTFRFTSQEVVYDPALVEPLNAEYFLLDVLRMVDEWPLLQERIPTLQMVLQKVNPGATLEVLAGTPWEKKRSFQMEVVYELVNGQRPVQEIIDLSFVGEFDTCKSLIALMDAGLIEPALAPPDGRGRKQVLRALSGVAASLALAVLGLGFILQLALTRLENFPFTPQEEKALRALQAPLKKLEARKALNHQEILRLAAAPQVRITAK